MRKIHLRCCQVKGCTQAPEFVSPKRRVCYEHAEDLEPFFGDLPEAGEPDVEFDLRMECDDARDGVRRGMLYSGNLEEVFSVIRRHATVRSYNATFQLEPRKK